MGVSQGESEGGQALNCCVVDISVFSVYSSSLFMFSYPPLPSFSTILPISLLSLLPTPPFLHPSLSSLPLPSSFPPSPPFPSFLLPSLSSLPLPLLLPFSSYPPFLLPSLRLALCLGHLWEGYEDARWRGVRDTAHEKLYKLLWDEVPEVRRITSTHGNNTTTMCTSSVLCVASSASSLLYLLFHFCEMLPSLCQLSLSLHLPQ